MTREDIMNSIQLKKRFCKDCGLPIAVYDNPYFYERLQIIDPLFDCVERFDFFCEDLIEITSEQEYFKKYNETKDLAIEHIRTHPDFIRFSNELHKVETTYPKRSLYVEENDGKSFISIDMKKANFSALNHYSQDIFNSQTWESFLGRFTDILHITESKYIRQVILGACNPKKQIQYEHFLMGKLLDYLMVEFPQLHIYSLGEDEIIIEIEEKYGFSLNTFKKVVRECPNGIGDLVRVEVFTLDKIGETGGWMKYNGLGFEFKCLNSDIFHQVVKHYYGEPITEDDLVFYHDGKLARFLKGVENPWKKYVCLKE